MKTAENIPEINRPNRRYFRKKLVLLSLFTALFMIMPSKCRAYRSEHPKSQTPGSDKTAASDINACSGRLCWFSMEKLFWLHPDLALINPKNDMLLTAEARKKTRELKKEIHELTSRLKKSYLFCEAEKRILKKELLAAERRNTLEAGSIKKDTTDLTRGITDPTRGITEPANDTGDQNLESHLQSPEKIIQRIKDLDNLYEAEKAEADRHLAELKSRLGNIRESRLPIDFLPGIHKDIVKKTEKTISDLDAAGAVNSSVFANQLSARKAMLVQELPDPVHSWLWLSNVNDRDLNDMIRMKLNTRAYLYTDLDRNLNLPELFGSAAGRDITDDILKAVNPYKPEKSENKGK